ncbi:MAG: ribosome silencing factor [Desulfofustis sp. PB-SRB1]|jgi:ribosome-associated protein|nr:ribosome silencing factor [Desulfofustis sp. PB-SRB1]MBM1003465.1 ribosome silencing factor [Desulfofustis sp. PB-SRB1]HBH28241.1 ribosome silencing factor [Desulfofustis sp.]
MSNLKKEYRDRDGHDIAEVCHRVATDSKGEEIAVLDVRGMCSFADYFVIVSGRSTRHVQAMAENIEHELRSKRINTSRAEGLREGTWVLLDFGDVIVHVFYHEQREFYDLDGLWHDAPRVEFDHDST